MVETGLKMKGTPLHDATRWATRWAIHSRTRHRWPNPINKFTMVFGLLAVSLTRDQGVGLTNALSAAFLLVALFFAYRSFYGMRIGQVESTETAKSAAARSSSARLRQAGVFRSWRGRGCANCGARR